MRRTHRQPAAPPLGQRLQRPARRRPRRPRRVRTAIARSRACAAAAPAAASWRRARSAHRRRGSPRVAASGDAALSRRDRRRRHVACPLQLASARSAEWRRVDANPDASSRLRSVATRVLAAHAAHVRCSASRFAWAGSWRCAIRSSALSSAAAATAPQTRAVRGASRPPPHARARGARAPPPGAAPRAATPAAKACRSTPRVCAAQPPRRLQMPEELPRAPAVRRRRRLPAPHRARQHDGVRDPVTPRCTQVRSARHRAAAPVRHGDDGAAVAPQETWRREV